MKTISEFFRETDGYERIHSMEMQNFVLFFELLAKQQRVDFDEFVMEEIENPSFFEDSLLSDTYQFATDAFICFEERHKDICLKYKLYFYF